MMPERIEASIYQLGKRRGALLKVYDCNGAYGYSDCHPWPELGDKPLFEQLQLLNSGLVTNITRQSLLFAGIDAYSRKKKRHLFHELSIPNSHYLLLSLNNRSKTELELALKEGFCTAKIKMGRDLQHEINILQDITWNIPIKIRLDCNNRLDCLEFKEFLHYDLNWNAIEYVEDPYQYHSSWRDIPIKIACDRQVGASCDDFTYFVLKPSASSWKNFFCEKPLVVTSNLGHPLGQVADAYVSGLLAKTNQIGICGLLSHVVYKRNAFSERLTNKGPKFTVLDDYGFGFSDLLAKQQWKELKKIV